MSSVFKCPNCSEKMEFEKQILFDEEYYDKWVCTECPLVVLDYRGDKELVE